MFPWLRDSPHLKTTWKSSADWHIRIFYIHIWLWVYICVYVFWYILHDHHSHRNSSVEVLNGSKEMARTASWLKEVMLLANQFWTIGLEDDNDWCYIDGILSAITSMFREKIKHDAFQKRIRLFQQPSLRLFNFIVRNSRPWSCVKRRVIHLDKHWKGISLQLGWVHYGQLHHVSRACFFGGKMNSTSCNRTLCVVLDFACSLHFFWRSGKDLFIGLIFTVSYL